MSFLAPMAKVVLQKLGITTISYVYSNDSTGQAKRGHKKLTNWRGDHVLIVSDCGRKEGKKDNRISLPGKLRDSDFGYNVWGEIITDASQTEQGVLTVDMLTDNRQMSTITMRHVSSHDDNVWSFASHLSNMIWAPQCKYCFVRTMNLYPSLGDLAFLINVLDFKEYSCVNADFLDKFSLFHPKPSTTTTETARTDPSLTPHNSADTPIKFNLRTFLPVTPEDEKSSKEKSSKSKPSTSSCSTTSDQDDEEEKKKKNVKERPKRPKKVPKPTDKENGKIVSSDSDSDQ